MARRFLAQRVGTRAWLHTALPLDGEPERALSSPGAFQATISPEILSLATEDGRPLLEPWGTLLYLEEEGEIRWAGIVLDLRAEGAALTVEAAGFSTYPHGMPFDGELSEIDADPADLVRAIWAHLQAYPDGDLGVVVTGETSARLGTEPEDVSFETGAGETVAFEAGPYVLHWADTVDCGREIDDLAKEALFDWVEVHRWNADGTDVEHEIRIADWIGATRSDLRFVQGENVATVVPLVLEGDDFANEIVALGAGEGEGALRTVSAKRDGRLRRAKVLERKDVRSESRLRADAAAALAASAMAATATEITVREHPNAPISAIQLGDVIHVQADAPWLGRTLFPARVRAIRHTSPTLASLSLDPML